MSSAAGHSLVPSPTRSPLDSSQSGKGGKEGGRRRKEEGEGRRTRAESERGKEGLLCSCTHYFSVNDLEPALDPREAVGSCVQSALCVQGLAGEANALILV